MATALVCRVSVFVNAWPAVDFSVSAALTSPHFKATTAANTRQANKDNFRPAKKSNPLGTRATCSGPSESISATEAGEQVVGVIAEPLTGPDIEDEIVGDEEINAHVEHVEHFLIADCAFGL